MKKIAIVMFVVSAALAGCGKKKAPDAPAQPAGDTAPAGDAPAEEGGEAPAGDAPADGAEGGEAGGM